MCGYYSRAATNRDAASIQINTLFKIPLTQLDVKERPGKFPTQWEWLLLTLDLHVYLSATAT